MACEPRMGRVLSVKHVHCVYMRTAYDRAAGAPRCGCRLASWHGRRTLRGASPCRGAVYREPALALDSGYFL
eukprot:4180896-Pleurochrysis_carterae.AAC.1